MTSVSLPTVSEALAVEDNSPRALALARLSRSRQQLRDALVEPAPRPSSQRAASGLGGAPLRWWRQLRRWAGHSPIGLAAASAVRGWWRNHPWRPAAEVGTQELRSTLLPLVRQHPWTSVAVAAGLGAALVIGRQPVLRWASAHGRPLPGQLAQWAWQQASSPATQAWLAGWLLSRHTPAPPAAANPNGALGAAAP